MFWFQYRSLPYRPGAEKLRNVFALTDAPIKLLRFVSDCAGGSKGVCP
jgi:hypothetical protein